MEDNENEKAVNDAQEETEDLNESKEDIEDEAETESLDEGTEDSDADETNADDESDEETEEDKETDKTESKEKPKQSKEENAKYAVARREAEEAAKKAESKYNDLKSKYESILSSDTDEKTRERWKEEAENKGIDPDIYIELQESKEYRRKQLAKEALAEAETDHKKKNQEMAKADMNEFKKTYPDVDVNKTLDSTLFKKFANHKLGNQPLAEIYSDFLEITGEAQKTAVKKVLSKTERSTGTSSGTTEPALTNEQKKALEDWNRRNPELKMTAKEYLRR